MYICGVNTIYIIQDLVIDKVIYVGRCKNPKSRFNSHMTHPGTCVYKYRKSKQRARSDFRITELEVCDTETAIVREAIYVRHFKIKGEPLLNKQLAVPYKVKPIPKYKLHTYNESAREKYISYWLEQGYSNSIIHRQTKRPWVKRGK